MTPLTRHQVLLYKGDFQALNDIYSSRSATEVIRELVRIHINHCNAKLKELKEKEDAIFAAKSVYR
jgi:hypothetical protein